MNYFYKALSGKGLQSGIIMAEDQKGLIRQLKSQGLMPVEIRPVQDRSAGEKKFSLKKLSLNRFFKTDIERLTHFTLNMANLTECNIEVEKALEFIIQADDTSEFMDALRAILRKLREGTNLAEAMRMHSDIFPEYYVAMIEAGSMSGQLSIIFSNLAEFFEKKGAFKKKIVASLTYPIILVIASLASIAILALFVLPKFEPIYLSSGQEIPLMTRMIVSSFAFLLANGLYILAFIIGLIVWFGRQMKNFSFRFRVHHFYLRIPLVKSIIEKIEMLNFSQSLATLMNGGVEILPALETAVKTVRNEYMRQQILDIRQNVKMGETLHSAFFDKKVLSRSAIEMLKVGEKTNHLGRSLIQIASILGRELDELIARFTAILLPALTVLIGLMVATIIMSILSLMLGINDLLI